MITTQIKTYRNYILCIGIFLAISFLSALIVKENIYPWYNNLIKPSYNPPSWIFGPVWTVLYTMLGILAATLLNNTANYRQEILIFGIHYLGNIAWTPLFFYFHRIDLALYDIIFMWILFTIFMLKIKNTPKLFWISVPYLLWISFATLLNWQLYLLN